MALAIEFQGMLDRGEVRRYSDLAHLGCVSRERISQLMMLTWLAPDIQEAILRLPHTPGGRYSVSEGALREVGWLHLWEDQRTKWKSPPTETSGELRLTTRCRADQETQERTER
jgi:hypothetical protein